MTLQAESVGGSGLEGLLGQLVHHISGSGANRAAVSAVLAQLLPTFVRCVPVTVRKRRLCAVCAPGLRRNGLAHSNPLPLKAT
jgi:hypothetical protein